MKDKVVVVKTTLAKDESVETFLLMNGLGIRLCVSYCHCLVSRLVFILNLQFVVSEIDTRAV